LHIEGPNCVCNAFYGLIDELEIKNMNVSQIGNGWVFLRHEQWQNSACFAQATPSRLGESCKVSCLGVGSPFSPRRSGISVERLASRSGERHSPRRGREGTWEF